MASPIPETYLARAEADAKRFKGILAPYVTTLAAEVRRLRLPPPPVVPPLVGMVNRQTAAMLAGKDPATDRSLFREQDPYAPRFTRNPTAWANATCLSAAQLSGTPWMQRAGTLVTKRHIVYAAHFGVPVLPEGTPILFVTRDSVVVQRKVVSCATDPASDIAVGLLDSDVSPGVDVAPVLPPDFETHLGARNRMLCVTLGAEKRANLQQFDTFFNGDFGVTPLTVGVVAPELKQYAAWTAPAGVGDSGHPAFLAICGELVLLGCFWTASGGPHIGARAEPVNAMISRLCPGYSLTVKQL